jgi:hypothetical protein
MGSKSDDKGWSLYLNKCSIEANYIGKHCNTARQRGK